MSNGLSIVDQVWYVGAVFMNTHYIVYDLTPADEKGAEFLQIGIGPKN